MTTHDSSYGGLLLADADLALLTETLDAGRRYSEWAAFRANEIDVHADSLRVTQHYHPEVLPPAAWRSLRLAFITLLEHHVATLKRLDRAEFEAVQERIERCKDKGLIP